MNPDHTYPCRPKLLAGAVLAALLTLGGCSDNDSSSTDTDNTTPVADAGADQTTTINSTVVLDGSDSSDADGDELSYSWFLTAVPSGSGAALTSVSGSSTQLTPDITGSYTLTLTVDDGEGGTDTDQVIVTGTDTDDTDDHASSQQALDPDNFISGALIEDITTESCTLGNGTETTCYKIVTAGVPADTEVGPFCPRTISDTADDAGIWLDGTGIVYDVDGDFITNLPTIYADDHWQLYDLNSGAVNYTQTLEACEAAARPDVAEEYQNHCVECTLEHVGGGISETFLIPVTPVPAATTGNIARVGVALNGGILEGSAPVDAILGAYTIAAFDDCGGHVNPVEGYHYHAATGCTETGTQADGHSALMGYALDGYGIYGRLNKDDEEDHVILDECRGATDDLRGYHYHVAPAGDNEFIGCFHGEIEESYVAGERPPR